MTVPVAPVQDPVADYLKAKQAAATDPVSDYLASKGQHDYHAEYASGALAKRMTGANARDAANVADEGASQPGYLERAATHVLNTAQGAPGVEAFEAGAGALGSKLTKAPMTYRQSLSSLRGSTANIGGKTSFAEHMAGALPVMAMLPANPAVSGAIVGGADQALSANPDESLAMRGAKTAGGAAVGAIAGKALDKGVTLARAALPKWAGGAGSSVDRMLQMQADRAQSAKTLYSSALAEGQGKEATPALQAYLAEPEIAERVAKLQELDPHKNLSPDSPEMLDALYKSFSDEAKAIKKSANTLDPSKVNLGRFRGQDIASKQGRLLKAMEAPGTKPPLTLDVAPETFETDPNIIRGHEGIDGPPMSGPLSTYTSSPPKPMGQALRDFPNNMGPSAAQGPAGPAFRMPMRADKLVSPGVSIETPGMTVQTAPAERMPPVMSSYRKAVEDFAQRSKEIDALQKGDQAALSGQSNSLASLKNRVRKSPTAFADWAKTASPDEIIAARQGVLGATKDALALPGKTFAPGRRTAGTAANLLRLLPSTKQSLLEGGQNLGLLTAGNSTP